MKQWIRRLSWKVELAVVLVLAFGWTLPSTLHAFATLAAAARSSAPPISDGGIWATIFLELIVCGVLVPFLRTRGWTRRRLGIRPSLQGCLHGMVLALAAYGSYFALASLVGGIWPAVAHALAQTRIVSAGFSWTVVVAGSIINPFYEEVFVCGYVITVLTERRTKAVAALAGAAGGEIGAAGMAVGLATAVNISTAIRLSYHLYQGVAGVLAVVPLGLLFGIWFARTRQLWPLIVAHAILDFVGLAAGVR